MAPDAICDVCGEKIPRGAGPGRPRKRHEECEPRRGAIVPLPPDSDHPLVVACRRELGAVGRLNSWQGVTLLLLARYVAVAEGRALVALSKEFRAAYAVAMKDAKVSVGSLGRARSAP